MLSRIAQLFRGSSNNETKDTADAPTEPTTKRLRVSSASSVSSTVQERNSRLSTSSSSTTREFKLVLVGDGGVGKTTLVKRHQTGEFEKRYIPTLGVAVTSLRFETNHGTVVFNVWDTAGQEKFGGLRDGYYLNADAAIIMFDVSSRITYQNVPRWYQDLKRECPSLPIVLVGNKVDLPDRELKAQSITWHKKHGLTYLEMSAKSQFNFEKPFLHLARQLTDLRDLQLVGAVARAPEVQRVTNNTQLQRASQDLALATSVRIADDDEDL